MGPGSIAPMTSGGALLVVAAIETEAAVVDGAETLVCGVGKTAAATATALRLAEGGVRAAVSFGIAGAYPGGGLSIGDVVVASKIALRDEGLETGTHFEMFDRADMPVPGAEWLATDPGLRALLLAGEDTDFAVVSGPVATVSVCAGTDRLARERSADGAVAESMEGAAVAHASSRLGVPFVEVRGISNMCGPRESAPFELESPLRHASAVLDHLVRALA